MDESIKAARKRKSGGLAETIRTFVYAVLIAIAVRTVAYEPFNIPSGSMIPTLLVGDYLFVSKFSYGYSRYSLPFSLPLFRGRIFGSGPERGDVVVFKRPPANEVDFVKRMVGIPGDRIQMRGGILQINGVPVARRRIEDFVITMRSGARRRVPQYIETLPNGVEHRIIEALGDSGPLDNTAVYVVPPGHYFAMGDNRDNSNDGRNNGRTGWFVPEENMIGRAEFLFFSTDGSAGLLEFWRWPFATRFERIFEAIH